MATRRGRSRGRSQADQASRGTPERPSGAGGTSLLASATTWPLKRYGRFLSPTDSEDGEGSGHSWKVFESNEETGHLILTIVVSGHFFISQGRTVLRKSKNERNPYLNATIHSMEGFSLIDSQKWLRIARRADCLLLHAQSKGSHLADCASKLYSEKLNIRTFKQNECRMFRVQFGGDSEEQMLEHCCSCVQKLAEFVPVHEADELSQNLCYSRSQVEDTEQSTSVLRAPDEPLPDSCTNSGERRSTMQLAQSVLNQKSELPLLYRHSAWSAQELGPFIRLCLMDQHFPAFVEDVEKELKRLTEG